MREGTLPPSSISRRGTSGVPVCHHPGAVQASANIKAGIIKLLSIRDWGLLESVGVSGLLDFLQYVHVDVCSYTQEHAWRVNAYWVPKDHTHMRILQKSTSGIAVILGLETRM